MEETQPAAKPLSGAWLVALLGFVGVAIGSFMPWARDGIFDFDGTDGQGLYTLVLALGGFVSVLYASRGIGWLALVAAGAASVIALMCLTDIHTFYDGVSEGLKTRGDPSTAPGLVLTACAAGLAFAAVTSALMSVNGVTPTDVISSAVDTDSR